MKRIIIDYDEQNFTANDAMTRVSVVIAKGLVSSKTKRNGVVIPHYGWVAVWDNDDVVWTRPKDQLTSADSFRVFNETSSLKG